MNQKRFLTADEVFQMFGVDAEALDKLVDIGAVTALKDRGSYRYRAEDFANLVQEGKLSPRTAGELFQMDSEGEIPILKVKQDQPSSLADESVGFIELDEEALDQQAKLNRPAQTPVVPDKWFESDDSVDLHTFSKTPDELSNPAPVANDKDKTDFDLELESPKHLKSGSDSNVRFVDDDEGGRIDLDEPQDTPSASDSDVRLEGPVSSTLAVTSETPKKTGSDSDVRLAKTARTEAASDSDVTISDPTSKSASDSDVTLASPVAASQSAVGGIATGKSDSDVVLHDPATGASKPGSDSDVVLVTPPETAQPRRRKSDSDSDVRIAASRADLGSDVPALDIEADDLKSIHVGPASDSDVVLDSEKTLVGTFDQDFEIKSGDSGITIDTSKTEAEIPTSSDSGLTLMAPDDSGLTLDTATPDSGITLDASSTDSEIAVPDPDSGLTLIASSGDSGIALEPATGDSGLTLDSSGDSGIRLQSDKTDGEISIDHDSGISLDDSVHDSGLTLQSGPSGSGLLEGDSGIRLSLADDDSGLSLQGESSISGRKSGGGDSGIRLADADSGISLHDEDVDSAATLAEIDSPHSRSPKHSDVTRTIDVSQDVDTSDSLSDHTLEMSFDDSDDESPTAPTIVHKGRSKPTGLSEAFKLDEPMEVEDLDISDDLEDAVEADFDEDFEEAEEVLEASDDDFSAGEISVAEASEDSLSEVSVPVIKTRALPKEPAWSLGAVIPIGASALAMAMTVLVLWGGVATMWTGEEAPGPAAILISSLAGLIPN